MKKKSIIFSKLSEKSRKYGFGLVGTGKIAIHHINAIKANYNAELIGIFSRSVDRAKTLASKHNVKCFNKYSDMLNDNNIDIIDIVTINSLHAKYAIQAIQHNKHVIVEKPIDTDTKMAERLVRFAKSKGKRLSCVSQFRFSSGIRQLNSMLKHNWFGKLLLIDVSIILHKNKDYYLESNWRSKKETAGGGVIIMNAIHVIDILLWLFGPIKESYCIKKTSREYIEVEDYAKIMLKFSDNILCNISVTNNAERNFPMRIDLYGTKRSLSIKNFEISDKLYPNFMKKYFVNEHYYQIKDIVDAIINKREPITSGKAGLDALKVVKKIYSSAKE